MGYIESFFDRFGELDVAFLERLIKEHPRIDVDDIRDEMEREDIGFMDIGEHITTFFKLEYADYKAKVLEYMSKSENYSEEDIDSLEYEAEPKIYSNYIDTHHFSPKDFDFSNFSDENIERFINCYLTDRDGE